MFYLRSVFCLVGLSKERPILGDNPKLIILKSGRFHADFTKSGRFHADFTKSGRFHADFMKST